MVAVNYNALELALDRILQMYLRAEVKAHAHIFKSLNTASQLALFELCISSGETDIQVRENLLHFSKNYAICYANRNLLMHSVVHADVTTDEILAHAKKSGNKPHLYNQLHLSLPELRAIANEMRELFVFAANTLWFIKHRDDLRDNPAANAKPLPSLPNRPSPPTNLAGKLLPNI